MPDSSANSSFTLRKPIDPGSLGALKADVATALAGGSKAVTIDIDEVGVLDTAIMAALIGVLRQARERGADVSLRAGKKGILETLRITGLDKVFSVAPPLVEPAAPALARRHKKARPPRAVRLAGGRSLAAFAGSFFAFGALLGGVRAAATDATAEQLLQNVVAQNAAIESYQAQVSVDFHLRTFPYVSEHLEGTTYFKRPDNFEVVFQKVPSYAKGFEKLYSDIDDPTSWQRRFTLEVVGERVVGDHRDRVIRLVQKVRGMIDHEDVAVDPGTWRIDEMEWHYYNGGVIAMSQEFENAGGFSLLAKQHATIRIPLVHAAAEATYRDYKTNVAIDDSIFSHGKR